MSWLAHGLSSDGLVASASHGQSKTVPAVAAHRGQLWCLWADFDGKLWYAATVRDGEFGDRLAFPKNGLPVIANLNGHLHAVIALEGGEMLHFLYDDDLDQTWDCLGPLDTAAGVVAHSSPCLTAFHNKLFLVYLKDNRLNMVIWTNSTAHPTSASNPSGTWSDPILISEEQTFSGIPALFVMDGVLHLLCATDAESRDILGYRYDYVDMSWTQCDDVSEGRAARGVSATSYGENAYLAFLENGPGDESHNVYVAAYQNGQWQPHESVEGQTASDPPQVAVLNGRIHCIFNDNSTLKNLRWYSRPVLGYNLSSWMEKVPDETLLSNMTIPGTHDTCARSNIPFVRTQYLSVTQQLHLGIRFLDLRLRRHDDGRLFCYHGGIPIDLPRGLSFESVMDEVWSFLRGTDGNLPATETVLVSINNDDHSDEQLENPSTFYAAVEDAMTSTAPYPDGTRKWFAEPVTPALGEVRGRAVLLRRYQGDPSIEPHAQKGLDLSKWLDDNPDFMLVTDTNIRVHIQDKWKYADRIALKDLVANKSSMVQNMMRQAAGGLTSLVNPKATEEDIAAEEAALQRLEALSIDSKPTSGKANGETWAKDWFINFCSAVGDPIEHGEIAEAKWIAVGAHSDWHSKWVNGMNVLTKEFLQRNVAGKKRLGVVNLDYPELPEDNDLVARLIETNF